MQALFAEPDPRAKLRGYAHIGRILMERSGALVAVLLAGAQTGDPDLADFIATIERERLTGTERIARNLAESGGLRADLTVERARDVLWVLTAPEVYMRFVQQRGWSLDDVERWQARAMIDALVG